MIDILEYVAFQSSIPSPFYPSNKIDPPYLRILLNIRILILIAFHTRCIDPWILDRDKSTCPLCKQPIERKPEDCAASCSHTQQPRESNHFEESDTFDNADLEAGMGATAAAESDPLISPTRIPGSPIPVHSPCDVKE